MILDAKLMFSEGQALTALASIQKATNIIDLGSVAGKDAFGNTEMQSFPKELTWFVNLEVAMVGASAILTAKIVTGSAVDSSAITGSVQMAELEFPALSAAGVKKAMKLDYAKLGRYLHVEYYGAPSAITSVTINSGLIHGYNDSEIKDKFQG